MASVNKVFLLGNLTRDPELRELPSGTTVCEFTLATNRQYKTSAGEERAETLFCDCAAFGRVGEIIAEYCPKGRQLFVEGRLHYESWEDTRTGSRRSKLSVVVESFQFLGPREDAQAPQKQAQSTGGKTPAAAGKPARRGSEPAPGAPPRGKAPQASTKNGRKTVDQAAEENEQFEAAELPF